MYNQNIKIQKKFNSVFLNWDVHLHFVHKDDGNYRAAYDEYSFRQMYYWAKCKWDDSDISISDKAEQCFSCSEDLVPE